MSGQSQADIKITQLVSNKLSMRGLRTPCAITVNTSNAQVTLSGTVPFAYQKSTATSVASGVAGVKRVVNSLVVKVPPKRTQ
jgi:osmotically-inducible protein OsmY